MRPPYPIDKIKIDRSFIQHLGSTPEVDAIVRAIVALGRAGRKRVLAEGVEYEEQRDHLAALDCHELQGFLLARPMPEIEFSDWVAAEAERTVASA